MHQAGADARDGDAKDASSLRRGCGCARPAAPRPRGSRCSATPGWASATTSTTTAAILVDDAATTPDDLRAISRVRFGVNMTGETDSGITFGADDPRGQRPGRRGRRRRPDRGQRLRLGQLRHAELRRHRRRRRAVGRRRAGQLLADRPRRPQRDARSSPTAAASATTTARTSPRTRSPARRSATTSTSRGFGMSLSSNRDLTDIGVGGGCSGRHRRRQLDASARLLQVRRVHRDRRAGGRVAGRLDPTATLGTVVMARAGSRQRVPTASSGRSGSDGEYETFGFGLTYTKLDSDTADVGEVDADNLLVGASSASTPGRSAPSTPRS